MNYTLHQLQVFVKVCETGSITKASEELFLTQPAVSIQLKKFQEQFDIPLTELVGRRLYITDFGNEIRSVCEEILDKSDLIRTTALQYEGLLAGKLTISVVSTGKYVMPYFMSEFVQNYSGVDIAVDVTNKQRVIESMQNNESEFALVSVLPDNMDVDYEELLVNRLYLVGGEQVKKQKVTKSELENLPFIFRENGSATRNVMEEYLESMGVPISSKLELVSNEAVKQAVCAGLGYSILPLIGMKPELDLDKLKLIESKGLPIETKWLLIYSNKKKLSPVGQAFLDHIKNNKKNILEKYFKDA